MNTGLDPVRSQHGLLSTVCYRLGDAAPVYALEGSIAVTGSLVQWFRDVVSGRRRNSAGVGGVSRAARCACWSIETAADYGMWGGMNEDERQALRRRGQTRNRINDRMSPEWLLKSVRRQAPVTTAAQLCGCRIHVIQGRPQARPINSREV